MLKHFFTYIASEILSRPWTRHAAFFLINCMRLEQLLRKLYRIGIRPPQDTVNNEAQVLNFASDQTIALYQQLRAAARKDNVS